MHRRKSKYRLRLKKNVEVKEEEKKKHFKFLPPNKYRNINIYGENRECFCF